MSRSPSLLLALLAFALASAPAWAQKVYKWTDDKGVTHYADSPPEGRTFEQVNVASGRSRTVDPNAPAQAGDGAAAASETPQCVQARANLDIINNNPVIRKDTDGDGTPENLSGAERDVELERAQKLVDAYCS